MQTFFSSYQILINIHCIPINVVNTAKMCTERNNPDTCQQKLEPNFNSGVFKVPESVKNISQKEISPNEHIANKHSNNTESCNFQFNNIPDSTIPPIPMKNESKLNHIRCGDNISDYVSESHVNPIPSLEDLIQSINIPDRTDISKDHRAIDPHVAKKTIEVQKVTDNRMSDSQRSNIKKEHTKTLESISHKSTSGLRYLNDKSRDINIQRHLCYDMSIDEYINMISEPHIYSIPPDFSIEEGNIRQPIFPLFAIRPHNIEDHSLHYTKKLDSTSTRFFEGTNTQSSNKKIDTPTDIQQSTLERHIPINKLDDYSPRNYNHVENPLKKRKLPSYNTFIDITGEGNDHSVTAKRKKTTNKTETFLNSSSNKTRNDNIHDFPEASSSLTRNYGLTKLKSKKCTTRDNSVTTGTNPSTSNANISETNLNDICYHTISLNGQNFQHNFKLPKNSYLQIENINGTLKKTKYICTVYTKYYHLNDTYRMNYYIPITNLNKIEIETLGNIKCIIFNVVSSKYKLQQNMHITLYAFKISDDTPHRVFIKKFLIDGLHIQLSNLLDVQFPVYKFLHVGSNKIIHFANPTPEKDMSSMRIRQYINNFQGIKHFLRTGLFSEAEKQNKSLNALRHAPTSDSRRCRAWFYVLDIIKDDSIAFIEGLENINQVLHDNLIHDDARKIQTIKTILEYIISRLDSNLYCFKIEDTSDKAYLYETLAFSFRMFLQTEIKGVFEYWIQYISDRDEMVEIFPISF